MSFDNKYNNCIQFLGGTLGLFTGMSILSMIEVVFWTLKYILNYLKAVISFKTLREDNSPV